MCSCIILVNICFAQNGHSTKRLAEAAGKQDKGFDEGDKGFDEGDTQGGATPSSPTASDSEPLATAVVRGCLVKNFSIRLLPKCYAKKQTRKKKGREMQRKRGIRMQGRNKHTSTQTSAIK